MPRTKKLTRRRILDHMDSTIRYYSDSSRWTTEGLYAKAIRLSIRLLAVDSVHRKRTGTGILTPSMVEGLSTFVALGAELDGHLQGLRP